MGPCAKQRVVALVSHNHPDHDPESVILGENICLTPQSTCPRAPGEAYAKCITHCSQLGHAEEVALRQIRMAGIPYSSITAIRIYGHHGPCDNCRALLDACGLLAVTTFHPEVRPAMLSQGARAQIAAAYNLYAPSSHSSAAAVADVQASR